MSEKRLDRVTITEDGEALVWKDNEIRADMQMTDSAPVGTHAVCLGDIRIIRNISPRYSVLFCERCGLRVKYAVRINTFGELAQWLEESYKQAHAHRRDVQEAIRNGMRMR